MFLAVDVFYGATRAQVAGVAFRHWEDPEPVEIFRCRSEILSGYRSGAFYLRELPCILQLLESVEPEPSTLVIDGHVYLDGESRPGLGRHLYDALDGRVKVVGVAKNPFRGMPPRCEVRRGRSIRPLYVTCVGMPPEVARKGIAAMHGAHRLPTLLKLADTESRATHHAAKETI